MKILLTSTYFFPYLSGLTAYPLKVLEHFSKQHEVSVLTFRHNPTLPLRETHDNIKITRLPVHVRISKGLINFFYPFISYKAVSRNDVVFVNLPQVEGFVAALWGRLLGKKTFAFYHCDLAFEAKLSDRFVAFITNCVAFVTCLLTEKIVALTEDYAKHSPVLKHFLHKIVYTLPPVEPAVPDPAYSRILATDYKKYSYKIGFSGRVAREKGLDTLFDALPNINEKIRQHVIILCAGPYGDAVVGEGDYFRSLEDRIRKERLPVVFLGKLTGSQFSSFHQFIDVLVLPSTNRTEAFGLVQINAMLSGTPVIVSDIPGVRVPVRLTGMGLLTKPKDSADLAHKIETVFFNRKKFVSPREKIVTIFDVTKTFNFFDTLIHG